MRLHVRRVRLDESGASRAHVLTGLRIELVRQRTQIVRNLREQAIRNTIRIDLSFLLPILLVSVGEWGRFLVRRLRRRCYAPVGAQGVFIACAVSAAYFSLLKLLPAFTPWHVALLRCLATPFRVSTAFRNVADPTDLVTLVTTPLAGWYLVLCRVAPGDRPSAS